MKLKVQYFSLLTIFAILIARLPACIANPANEEDLNALSERDAQDDEAALGNAATHLF